jgi:carboxylesterase type B
VHLLDKSNENLFQGAILQSGSANTVPTPRTEDYQEPYDDLVRLAGCSGATNTLDCLKGLTALQLTAASFALSLDKKYKPGLFGIIWRPTIDGEIIPESPYKLLNEGKLANIPFMAGNNKDEGTLFVDWFIQSQDDIPRVVNSLMPKPIDDKHWASLFQRYPNDPTLGSPFNTGSSTFGLSPAFKQVAAIASDALFVAKRRQLLRQSNKFNSAKTWTYLFEGSTPIVPEFLGGMHALDIPYTYGIVTPWIPLVGWRFQDRDMSQQMIEYW